MKKNSANGCRASSEEKIWFDDIITPKVNAEWDEAKDILISSPGIELARPSLNPSKYGFESVFNLDKAITEHNEFKRVLREDFGVNVYDVKSILKNSEKSRLGTLAYQLIDPNCQRFANITQNILNEQETEGLLNIIFKRQLPHLFEKSPSELDSLGIFSEIANHYFQRDPQITTDKGVVIGRMKNEVRFPETLLSKFVFDELESKPVYQINLNGTLEGGDFTSAKDYALIGVGSRTNLDAAKQLLENGALGYKEVAIVNDSHKKNDEMHLDTYFNFVSHNKALILEDRINTKNAKSNPNKVLHVTVYRKEPNGYVQYSESNEFTFQKYLENKGVQLIPVSKHEQMNYGVNILTLSENNIIAVKGLSDRYYSRLGKEGINVTKIDLTNLTKGYGGPHCMTQVLRRD